MVRRLFFLLMMFLLAAGPAFGSTERPDSSAGPTPADRAEAPPGPADAWLGRLQKGLSINRPTYVLFLSGGSEVHSWNDSELKFQLSIKQHLYRGLYFGYTQKSFWRIWDQAASRPFRETNFNLEIFWRSPFRDAGRWGKWQVDIAPIEHESNGRDEPTSRSWNRAYIRPRVAFDHLDVDLKLWHRYSEQVKRFPDDPAGDENADIQDFLGNGELRLGITTPWSLRIDLMGRCSLDTGKGAVQADLSYPVGPGNLAIYLQYFRGYGESLIDYDRFLTSYGIGLRVR